jgi:5'-nucleotidase/UDP-sugar diphosphatase
MELSRMCRLAWAVRLFLVIAGFVLGGAASADTTHVTFLHLNDVYDIAPPDPQGGLAEAATLIRSERAREINTIVTFGGNLLSPSFMSGLTQGRQMIDVMNDLGVDYAGFGNHEFDFGPDVLRQRIQESKFVWLATSTRDAEGKPFGNVQMTAIRRIGGVTLGFFAVLSPETANLSLPGPHVVFLPPDRVAEEAVKVLRAAGADVVIALTHQSIDEDKALVRAVQGIDLVLGGDEKGPVTIEEQGVPIIKTIPNAEQLAVVDMTIERDGDHLQVSSTRRFLSTAGVTPNAKLAAKIKAYVDDFDRQLAAPVAKTAIELDSREDLLRTDESSMGDLIADAMRTVAGTDVALINSGAIRGNRLYPAGSVLTLKDIQRELPFNNTLTVVELKGADLRAALENGVSKIAEKGGRFLQVAGLAFSVDAGKAIGKRVDDVTIAGSPLDPKKLYKVAISDYLAHGGDDYDMLHRAKIVVDGHEGQLLTQVVADYLRSENTILLQPGSRISRAEP